LGLTWDDVDLDAGTIRIARTLQYNQARGFDVLPPKTRRSARVVVLATVARVALTHHQARQTEARERAAAWEEEYGDLVFPDGHGRPLLAPNISKRLRRHLEAQGLPRIRFHDLRHGFASMLLAQGVPARVAMEVLGHSDIATTSNIYQHVGTELRREAAEAIDRAILPAEVGDLVAAMPFLTRALAMYEKALGRDDPRATTIRRLLEGPLAEEEDRPPTLVEPDG
jgi:integrase